MSRALIGLAVVAAGLLAVPSVAPAKIPRGPSGTGFYEAPSPLPGKRHRHLIWWGTARGADTIRGARYNRLVLYRSRGVAGRVAVSGSVAVPRRRPPRGGWPVVTWAHGTTGVADHCAPTRDGRLSQHRQFLFRAWLRRGYAVVRTDYEGLGTPANVHPYLNGPSAGRSVIDIVRAARQLDRRIGSKVIVAGESQGGQAALFAASVAPRATPELRVRGTVAFAPANHLSEQLPLVTALATPSPALSAYAMMIGRGLDLARPSLNVPAAFSPLALARYGNLDDRCEKQLKEPGSFGDVPPADLFKDGTNFAPFAAVLDRLDDPENLTIRTPVRVDQGLADTTVFPNLTQQTVDAYRSRGTRVTYGTWQGADHGGVTRVAAGTATRWLARRLR